MKRRTALIAAAFGLVAVMAMSGCTASASATSTQKAGTRAASAPAGTAATELRLGYFANVTHAPALVGVQTGILQKSLGATKLTTQLFNAGPAEIEALNAGAIDAAYIGPSPAINTFLQSGGASARIVAGVTTGGAALIVRKGIDSAKDLVGKTLATPQLGNTQDVALRSWLSGKGLKTDTTGGGEVHITPTDNAQALALFQSGKLDGAWLPEPWVSRFVLEGGAHVLVDEATLWKGGVFPTTVLLVSKDFLAKHPQSVKALVSGNEKSIAWLNTHAADAPATINKQLVADAGKGLSDAVLKRSLEHVKFSSDPVASAFPKLLKAAVTAGTGKTGSLDGLFDLTILNSVRKAAGEKAVSAGSLGAE